MFSLKNKFNHEEFYFNVAFRLTSSIIGILIGFSFIPLSLLVTSHYGVDNYLAATLFSLVCIFALSRLSVFRSDIDLRIAEDENGGTYKKLFRTKLGVRNRKRRKAFWFLLILFAICAMCSAWQVVVGNNEISSADQESHSEVIDAINANLASIRDVHSDLKTGLVISQDLKGEIIQLRTESKPLSACCCEKSKSCYEEREGAVKELPTGDD